MRDLTGEGTPESEWMSWPGFRHMPMLAMDKPPATAVVVAPHPDDEVLGVGGLLHLLARSDVQIHLIAVTDGEGSHPKSPTYTPRALAARRIDESTTALETLAVKPESVERLHLPDGDVRRVEARNASVTAAVIRTLSRCADRGAAWCIAPWPGDGHPDHDAAGRAAITAAAGTARLLAYPVWLWHWGRPGEPNVPWWQARRVVLPEDVHHAKLAAVEAFTSQTAPLSEDPADAAILPPHILRRLVRRTEVLFELDSL